MSEKICTCGEQTSPPTCEIHGPRPVTSPLSKEQAANGRKAAQRDFRLSKEKPSPWSAGYHSEFARLLRDSLPNEESEPLDIAGIRARCEAAANVFPLYGEIRASTARLFAQVATDLPAALDRIEELEAQLASKAPSPDIAGITRLIDELCTAAHKCERKDDFLCVGPFNRVIGAVSKILEERDAALKEIDHLHESFQYTQGVSHEASIRSEADLRSQLASSGERLREALRPALCGVCGGEPLKSGKRCVCNGEGTEAAEMAGLRLELYESAEREAVLGERLKEMEARQVRLAQAANQLTRAIKLFRMNGVEPRGSRLWEEVKIGAEIVEQLGEGVSLGVREP